MTVARGPGASNAVVAVERADGAIAEASVNAVKHLTDQAMGTAGEAPQTIREAKIALAESKDRLEACRESREILTAGLAEDKSNAGIVEMRLEDCARAVVRAETRERALALAERVQRLQRELVAEGSGLQWLEASAGVFGRPPDRDVLRTITRLHSSPLSWTQQIPGESPFALPIGAQRWAAAFEALQRDANAPLPAIGG